MAPQPPGPGLPLQAPSVKIATSAAARGGLSDIDAVSGGAGNVAMKPELLQELDRVLGLDQCPRGLVQPVVQPGQQKPQRAAPRKERQRGKLGGIERPQPLVLPDQEPCLGDIEAEIGLEAP